MAAEVFFAPEVEQDLVDAYAWYEERRVGLGEDFLSSTDACIEAISRNPMMHGVVHEKYRRALLRRFPYAVFYECENDIVTVYAVFHFSRDPKKWRKRLL